MKAAQNRTHLLSFSCLLLACTIVLIALFVSCIQRKPERLSKRESPVTGELNSMLREHESLSAGTARENDLRARVYKRHREMIFMFLSQALIVEAIDLHRAALLLAGSNDTKDPDLFLLAYNLASEAAHKGNEESRYLTAACMDQYLLAQDLPQKYGTQQYKDHFGRICLSYLDTLTSDSERAVWNVPPLDSIKKLISAQNR